MAHPICPVKTLVPRLWREPGEQEAKAAWCGSIRTLEARDNAAKEIPFPSLENLLDALRPFNHWRNKQTKI